MKKIKIIISTVLILFVSMHMYSQSKIYYDADWELTSIENAHFYRLIDKKNDSLFNVKDFYISNVLQMEGHFSNLEEEVLEGIIYWYTEQGNMSNSETYTKGVLNGISNVYLENGEIEYTCEYKNGKVYDGVDIGATGNYFYKKGRLVKRIELNPPNEDYILSTKIYGTTIDSVFWRTSKGENIGLGIYKNGKIQDGLEVVNGLSNTLFTNYKNGKKDGILKVFDSNASLLSEKTFVKDTLLLDKTMNPLTGKIVECVYKNDRGFEGRYFEYNDMFKYYREVIFEKGKLITKNCYVKEDGKWKLVATSSF